MYILFFNGPPGSGKDALAECLSLRGTNEAFEGRLLRVFRRKLRHILDEQCASLLGWSVGSWRALIDDREKKGRPHPALPKWGEAIHQVNRDRLDGWLNPIIGPYNQRMSPREFAIYASECILKPLFGASVFGTREYRLLRELMLENQQSINTVMYTDCGFPEEVLSISAMCPPKNQVIIRLHREGCDFKNDSRDYVPDASWWKEQGLPNMNVLDFNNSRDTVERSTLDLISLLMSEVPGLEGVFSLDRLLKAR